MQIIGGNPAAKAIGANPLPGNVNYFIGDDPKQWHANVPTFGGVKYQDMYAGIDLVYYDKTELQYDFVVRPAPILTQLHSTSRAPTVWR